MRTFEDGFNEIGELLQKRGRAQETADAVRRLLAEGAEARDILEKALIPGLKKIINRFPYVLFGAHALNRVFPLLKPALFKNGEGPIGRGLICTVKGDLHHAGKSLVKMMIEYQGIEMIDLGVDCGTGDIIRALNDSGAQVICLSSLMSTTMGAFKDTIESLKNAGLRDKVKVMIGGPLVTQDLAGRIGADAYTPEAISAAEVCRSFFSSGATVYHHAVESSPT
jgi:5-methyltetrahydrofolate--homocysteine methyltransferase